MAFDSLVRNMVKLADRMTASLQVQVIHKAWISQSQWGDAVYAAQSTAADGSPLTGAVVIKQMLRSRSDGTTVMTKAAITFPEPVPVNGTPGRTEPIDPRDYIELPNGITGPIVNVEGPLDPGTNEPFVTEVWLG